MRQFDRAVHLRRFDSEVTRPWSTTCGECQFDCRLSLLLILPFVQSSEFPIDYESIPNDLELHIRVEPRLYQLGYSIANESVTWIHDFPPSDLPVGFDGAMFVLFASGNSLPWPFDAPQVGFSKVEEEYYDEGFGDHKSNVN
jgi:hypothetical protein